MGERLFIFSMWYHPSHFGMHVDDVAAAFGDSGYDVTIVTVSRTVFDLPYFDMFRQMFDVAGHQWRQVIRLNVERLTERGANNPVLTLARDGVFDECLRQIEAAPCHLLHFFEMMLDDFNAETVAAGLTTSLMYAGNFVSRIMAQQHAGNLAPTADSVVSALLSRYSVASPDGTYRLRGVDCILSETKELPVILADTRLRTAACWTSRPIFCQSVLSASARDVRGDLGFPCDARILLYAGRPSKNARILPTILRLVRQLRTGEPIVLLLIGMGDGDVAEWPLLHEVSDHVRAVPFMARAELFGVMKSSDVFVYPGLLDGYPKVVSEANLAGIPIVAFSSATSGLHEMIDDGQSALLIDVASPTGSSDQENGRFAAAVAGLLADPALSARLSERAFASAMAMDAVHFVARIEASWASYRAQ